MKLFKVKLNFSTAFHPQTDGQSERAFRTLQEMHLCFVTITPKDWDQYLPGIEFAYNNHIIDATKQTLFFLEYGQHPFSISNIIHSDHIEIQPSQNNSTDFSYKKFQKQTKSLSSPLKKQMIAIQKNTNKKRRDFHFKVGDKVMLSTKNLSIKTGRTKTFEPKFVGPITVTDVLGTGNPYRLDLPPQYHNLHPTFHISLLKAFGTDRTRRQDPKRFNLDYKTKTKDIERVLAYRIHNGYVQFLVHFKNSDSIDDTWINKHDLQGKQHLSQAHSTKIFEDE